MKKYFTKICPFIVSKYVAILLLLLVCNVGKAQINITAGQTATALAQKLVGTGVTISNATLACPSNANGIFTVVTSNLGLDSGIVLTSGQAVTVGAAIGINTAASLSNSTTTTNNSGADADLTTLATVNTFDACKLEFDFVPAGDTIKFDYVFGSEEYPEFACGSVNDAFGFFINGPGITGSFTNNAKNIALIPGTSIPVTINSINSAPTGTSYPISTCNSMGTGSPFAMYYINNSPSTTIMYDGLTTILTAISAVTPCTTYHLKIAIADGGDAAYDSGVFLKAGSLTSNAITLTPIGGGGLSSPVPYCVRGCLPGRFLFSRPMPSATPLTIHYQIQGTAVNGVDYTLIPDSVVIAANQDTVSRLIFGIPVTPATGPQNVKLLVYSPYACATPVVVDSAELFIYDSIIVNIPTPDTTICKLESVQLDAIGDPLLTYSWSPTTGLSNPNIPNPIATPLVTTTYTVSAVLPNSGCPPGQDRVTITIKDPPVVDAGADRITCLGVSLPLNLTVTPTTQTYKYKWTPATYLSNDTIPNPICTPGATITYFIEVDPGAAGCIGYDTLNIKVLPNDFSLFNHDTAICKGATVQINALGDTSFNYLWTPGRWVSDSTIINPAITPDTSQQYTITASYPGCPNIVKPIYIDVQPNPLVNVGADREKCQWDTIQIKPVISPDSYPNYSYSWTPTNGVNVPTTKDIVFSGQADVKPLLLTVSTPAGCRGTDGLDITVHKGNFGKLAPADTGICPRDSVHLRASGGVKYLWSPYLYLTSDTAANVVSYTVTHINYSVLITDQFNCFDTLDADIIVHPDAVMELGDNATIYPGESVQMDPKGNCYYYSWFPPIGLNSTTIANPIASPPVNTRYFVKATTEWGCEVSDSIDVFVNPETLLDLPNAFSPGSQPNGEIKIIKRGIATLKYFRIFNRWGAKVFETSNIDEGWNGQFKGTPQPMGVYVYMIEAETNTGRRFTKQGNITLIR